jgi:Uma2 family endonuclease
MAAVTTPTMPTPIEPSPMPAVFAPATADPASLLMASRHRITLEEYRRMAEAGLFGPEPKIELIEGVLVDKMTRNLPHVHATNLIQDILHHFLPRGSGFWIQMSNPVVIEDRQSEPEPDATIVRGTVRDFGGRIATPADAAVVIEVADTSYAYDRNVKTAVYATGGVPIYWILDLNRRRLEVLTKPAPAEGDASARYEEVRIFEADDEVPLVLDGREVGRFAVREILP